MPPPPAPLPASEPPPSAALALNAEAAATEADVAEAAARRGGLSPWQLAWPLALSLGALVAVLWATYEPGAFGLLRAALRPGLLALALAALVAQEALGALRLRYVSHGQISFRNGLRGQLTWDFASAISPAIIGGGPLASVVIAAENRISVGRVAALLLFLMLTDQIWFILLIPAVLSATTYVDVFPRALGPIGAGTLTAYFGGMMVWAAFFAYATLIRPEILERVAGALFRLRWLRRFEGRVRVELGRLGEQARVLRGQPLGFFVGGVALSASVWVCRYLVLLFVAWSVTPGLHVVEFLFRAAALWLAALVLPTPGGSGGMEGLFVLFLAPLLPPGFAGPTLLTWRLLTYYLLLVVGLGVTWRSLHKFIRHRRATAR